MRRSLQRRWVGGEPIMWRPMLLVLIPFVGGCGTSKCGSRCSDADADSDSDTDSGTDWRGGCEEIEGGAPGEETFSADVAVLARSQAELDDAWAIAFTDPVPQQPAVDWASQEVVVYASTESCPAACSMWLLDCDEARHALVQFMWGDCDAEWPVGGVLVVPRDDRPVDFEARNIGDCTSGN